MKDTPEHRIGLPGRAVLRTVLSFIGLVLIPLLALRIVDDPACLDTLVGQWIDTDEIVRRMQEADLSTIRGILERALLTAAPMVVLAFPVNYYEQGNRWRMRCLMVRSVVGIARYLYIVNLGDLAGIIVWHDASSDAFLGLDLALTGYLIIRIVIDLIDIPMAWAEFKDHRDTFIEEHTDHYGRIVKRSARELRGIRKEKAREERWLTPGTPRCRRCT